ncbi:AI-2E family transporter [Streptomyces sp. V4-01]|uniref:AI-2E family transporter n=1 Tax=Actinacidiphila polyblastidii TaxID=3110430 RepID=A0ABU7PCJ2_9ACTN|nr:AI-2E family transporter [Streptomyces sp. V4-01]
MPDKRHWSAALAHGLADLARRIEQRQAAVSARDAAVTGAADAAPVAVSAPAGSPARAEGRTPPAPEPPPAAAPAPAARARRAAPRRPARVDPGAVVPWSMRVAAEVGWRLLVLAGTVWVLMRVIGAVRLVVLAFVAGLLITALLQPFVARLKRAGVPRSLATALVCIGGFVVMGLVGWFVVWQVMDNIDNLSSSLQDGISEGKKWLLNSPFHVTDDQINQVANNLSNALSHNTKQLTDAGLQGVTFLVELLTGMLLAMFSTIFLLYDGPNIWNWVLRLFPEAARDGLAGAGPRAWETLTGYVRGTVIVAMIDAIFIGVGIFFLGVPMAVPLAVVIFLSSFVPLVGAVASGAVAVVVSLVTQGPFTALMVLVVVLAVQQIEGHILQPFILGRAVRVHPLAVVLSVAAGSLVAGIGGAVVAVPLVAVGNTVVGYLRAHNRALLAEAEALADAEEAALFEQQFQDREQDGEQDGDEDPYDDAGDGGGGDGSGGGGGADPDRDPGAGTGPPSGPRAASPVTG